MIIDRYEVTELSYTIHYSILTVRDITSFCNTRDFVT